MNSKNWGNMKMHILSTQQFDCILDCFWVLESMKQQENIHHESNNKIFLYVGVSISNKSLPWLSVVCGCSYTFLLYVIVVVISINNRVHTSKPKHLTFCKLKNSCDGFNYTLNKQVCSPWQVCNLRCHTFSAYLCNSKL